VADQRCGRVQRDPAERLLQEGRRTSLSGLGLAGTRRLRPSSVSRMPVVPERGDRRADPEKLRGRTLDRRHWPKG
jgi:hypothetical protein